MNDKSPAFQFYPKDFLTDVKQMSMSLPAAGAYWRLCCHCWLEGSLPDDLGVLARLCGATSRQIKELWPAIAPCFRAGAEGRLIHPRLEFERTKQQTFRQRQSDKGRAAAAMRETLNRKATEPQPESNRTSTEPQPEGQPKLNSPISDLQSPISDLHTAVVPARASVLGGTLPRDFAHVAFISKRGKDVPMFLHREFCRSVDSEQPDRADARLKAFYEAVELGWPVGAIGDEPIKLWRREFAAKFPSVAPTNRGKTAGNDAALASFVARHQEKTS